jgi:peptide/nickel transport system permease protein
MRALVARRIIQAFAIVFLAATITFFLIHLAPGDPFSAMDNPLIPQSVRDEWRKAYGFDRPVYEQYLLYLHNVARGDFGYSFSMHRPVGEVLGKAILNTLQLMAFGLAGSFVVGIALGVLQAYRRGTSTDRALSAASLFFYSMPDFWLALMAVLLFSYWIPLFPSSGMYDPVLYDYRGFWGKLGDRAAHLVLPVSTLVLLTAAVIARYQRAAMLEVGSLDFVRTARAKGVRERAVVLRHMLRNALLPVITIFGLALPLVLGGTVFIEQVFAWPGMGRMTVNAIATRDYPLITASVIIGSALVSAGSLLADLLYVAADPRLRTH